MRAATDSDHLLSITDDGWWTILPRIIVHGENYATMLPMRSLDGSTIEADGMLNDAEGVALDPTGAVLVSFEQTQRIWAYAGDNWTFTRSSAVDIGVASVLSLCNGASGNHGVEALDMLDESRLMAICEGPPAGTADATSTLGFLFNMSAPSTTRASTASRFQYHLNSGLSPTDLARLPPYRTGEPRGVLVLERDYTPGVGNRIQIRYLRPDAIGSAAQSAGISGQISGQLSGQLLLSLQPSIHHTDNFEGLAIAPVASANSNEERVRLLLISDDNANPSQRTLLCACLNRAASPPSA